MPEPHHDGFADDAPLTSQSQDRLNRAPFASQVAKILLELPAQKGLVIGIHGPWGDGKTTVLNLIRADLHNVSTVVVRDFNPWRLTDDDAMLRGFMSMLAEAIGASLKSKKEKATGYAGKLAGLGRVVSKPLSLFWKTAETIDGLLSQLSDLAKSGDSLALEELRRRVVVALGKSTKRVIILVDDLDRLDRDETPMVLRLVKACADLPNVCFVLAFDDDVVAAAIGHRYADGGPPAGRAFLEKIIQVPLRLPVAAREDLRSLCLQQVDEVLAASAHELTEDEVGEFVTGFDLGMMVRLTTPRAAKRYGNGLNFALPSLVGEVNTVDLMLVEGLRAFYPDIYAVVRDNHSDFSGSESSSVSGANENLRSKRLLDPVLNRMPQDEADAAKRLLSDLFPRVSYMYGRPTMSGEGVESWTRERRISAPQYCARYFTYAVPHGDVSDAHMVSLLSAASRGETDMVRETLSSLLGGKLAARTIEKLRVHESTVDPTAATTLSLAIARLAPLLPNPPALISYTQPPGQSAILISHLLARIPDREQRLSLAAEILRIAEPLWFAVECIRWFRVTEKPEKEDANALSYEEEARARKVLVDRIREFAAADKPLFDSNVRELSSALFEWQRAEGREPVQEHLLAVFERDPSMVGQFLKCMANRSWSSQSPNPRLGDFNGDSLRKIRRLIELNLLARLIHSNCPGDFTATEWSYDSDRPDEQRLAEQFMFIYNKWQSEGEPPPPTEMGGEE